VWSLLQHVDPVVARSFAQLAAVAVNKHKLESDPLLSDKALSMGIEALSLDGGGSIDDLDLDFTLPGYPDIELKPGGKDVAVNIHNLDEYLKMVVDWTLVRGVARQVESFKEGVASVLPLSSLHTFYPSEVGPHTRMRW
jgi:E3 ubiquitin-protein ligase TRIP12